jgi:hypothetical protein
MKAAVHVVVAVLAFGSPCIAQTAGTNSQPGAQRLDARARRQIEGLAGSLGIPHVPPPDSFAVGGRTIPAGTSVTGDVGVANGPLEVRGRIDGSAIVFGGDIQVETGGMVAGDAIAIGGRVQLAGGVVQGEIRSFSDAPNADGKPVTPPSEPLTTWRAVKLVVAWFAVLVVIGIGVVVFAEPNLDGVVLVLQRRLAASFWTGVLAQMALMPVLLLLVVALAISLIGILLIPFAIVAYVVAAAGLLALGFLAVARFTGRGLAGSGYDSGSRSDRLRALFLGLATYLGAWLIVAALTSAPATQPVLRAIALAVTWVALTVGLGATVLSRAGTQHERAASPPIGQAPNELAGWQTPTPVVGVAAARRPVPASKELT